MAADHRRAAVQTAGHCPRRPGAYIAGGHAARKSGERVAPALQRAGGVGSNRAGLVEMLMGVDETGSDRQVEDVDAWAIGRNSSRIPDALEPAVGGDENVGFLRLASRANERRSAGEQLTRLRLTELSKQMIPLAQRRAPIPAEPELSIDCAHRHHQGIGGAGSDPTLRARPDPSPNSIEKGPRSAQVRVHDRDRQ
jgi:hypothetical protein